MAQYEYPFSGQVATDFPAGMTARWATASTTWSIIDDSGYPWLDDGMGIRCVGSGSARRLLTWDAIDSDDERHNVEVVTRYWFDNFNSTTKPCLAVRASGTEGNETAYVVDTFQNVNGNFFRLGRLVNGSYTSLELANVPTGTINFQTVNGWWNIVKFQVWGSSIKLKVWNPIDPEPEDWLMEVTDTSIPGPGWVGLSHNGSTDWWTGIRVATDMEEVAMYDPEPAEITQLPILLVESKEYPVRVTQLPINLVYVPIKPGRITQLALTPSFILDPVLPKALLPVVPVVEEWEWNTTVFKSYAGREQRMALRDQPYLKFRYNLAVLKDEDRQTFMYTMHRHIGNRLTVPLFMYTTRLLSTASIGSDTLDVNTLDGNFRENETIAVFNADLSFYRVLETATITSGSIQLKIPLEEELAGGLYVAPAPYCQIEGSPSIAMGVFYGNATISFVVEPPRDLVRPEHSASLDFFDAFPILPERFLNPTGHPEALRYNLQTMETAANLTEYRRTWRSPQLVTSRSYLTDRDELDYWRLFGNFIKGGRGLFLIPSYRNDFTPIGTPALEATEFLTADTYVADYFKFQANRYLRFVSEAGVYYRKIRDAVLNMDRTVTIRLTEALPSDAGSNIFSMISIMHQVRLSDDVISVTHASRHVEVDFGVVSADR